MVTGEGEGDENSPVRVRTIQVGVSECVEVRASAYEWSNVCQCVSVCVVVARGPCKRYVYMYPRLHLALTAWYHNTQLVRSVAVNECVTVTSEGV